MEMLPTNNPDLKFKDISSEIYREYLFPKGEKVRIERPMALNYNPKSGGHRVQDSTGKAWYIPAGWICLTWENIGYYSFNF